MGLGGLPQVVDDGTAAYMHDVTGNSVGIDTTTDDPVYPLGDALGSTRLLVDDTGTAIGDTTWDAWGNEQTTSGQQYEFGWTGEQYDPSSDLTYLRARYYSPGTATFLSRDTVQPNAPGTGGYNPYSYANGNPTTFTDPSGHVVSYGDFGGSGIGKPFLYLAYIFECFLSGDCRYGGEHTDNSASEMVGGGRSASVWSLLALAMPIFVLASHWPELPSFPSPGDIYEDIRHFDWEDILGDDGLVIGICDPYVTGLGCAIPEDCGGSFFPSLQELAANGVRPLVEGIMAISLPNFVCVKNRYAFGSKGLDWSDDKCSHSPDNPLGIAFEAGCLGHDFGYRNFKLLLHQESGPNFNFLSSWERTFADARLHDDLTWTCHNRLTWIGIALSKCLLLADAYYWGVQNLQ